MRRMKRALLAAVIAGGTGLAAIPVWAQVQIVNDGRAMDANTRAGSGGFNDARQFGPNVGLPSQNYVTGNVTAGQHFRDTVPYGDPRAFRGPTAGQRTDAFVRQSAGVPIPGMGPSNAQAARPFYGESRAVPPPPGFVQQGFSGGYVPAPRVEPLPSDLRAGRPFDDRMPAAGGVMMPGPVTGMDPTMVTASPLYGVRQWQVGDTGMPDTYTNLLGERARGGLDPATIQRMRDELRTPGLDRPQEPAPAGQPIDARRLTGLEAPGGQAVSGQPLPDRAISQGPIGTGELATGQFVRHHVLDPQMQQSPQYAQLREARQRLFGDDPQLREHAESQRYNQELRLRQQLEQQREAETEQAPGVERRAPEGRGVEARPQDPAQPPPVQREPAAAREPLPAQRPAPVEIRSFAAGIEAQGLQSLLTEAEQLMREGKWITALQRYDDAARVAPDERLIFVGRAVAQLGATYYGRSESDLRRAFTADRNLLMATYDLQGLLGEERLQFITEDLKAIANKEQQSPRPLFLLAFIAYNTGHERSALGYIDLAEKRAGGRDDFYQLLRTHWSLPQAEPRNK